MRQYLDTVMEGNVGLLLFPILLIG
jgi:hypothetical protein